MIKKLFSTIIAISLFTSVIQCSVIAEENDAVFHVTLSDGTDFGLLNASDTIKNIYLMNKENLDATITLTRDYTIEATEDVSDDKIDSMNFISPMGNDEPVFDLGGHTLTIVSPNDASDGAIYMALCVLFKGTIKNGTIILADDQLVGIYIGHDNATIENVTIKAANGVSDVSCIYYGYDGGGASTVKLINSVIDMGAENPIFAYSEPNSAGTTEKANIISGCYKNLDLSSLPNGVSLAENSTVYNMDGVNSTVVISPDTNAIVVDNEIAYTYDNLDEAKADASESGSKLFIKKDTSVFEREIVWSTDSDAGYYVNADTNNGVIRFLFNSGLSDEDVIESGIKFFNSADITEQVDVDLKGNKAVFYGDIINIPESNNNPYFAIAYVKTTDGTTSWSMPVSCIPDFNKPIEYTN